MDSYTEGVACRLARLYRVDIGRARAIFERSPHESEARRLARRYHLDIERVRAILERITRESQAGHLHLLPNPIVPWMLHDLPTDVALRILETENLRALNTRFDFASRLATARAPVVALNKLADINQFLEYLHRNRQDLLDTGLPRTAFPHGTFLSNRLGKLYFTKLPIGIRTEWDTSGTCTYHYTWSTPSPERADAGVPIIDGLSPTDAQRLEASRGSLYELRVQVLRVLAAALHRQDPTALWPDCLRLLTEALTYDDAIFYLRQDNTVYNTLAWIDPETRQDGSHSFGLRPGGLSDLLEVVGWYERELTVAAALDRATTAVSKLTARVGIADWRDVLLSKYHTTLAKPWREDLDRILDELAACWPRWGIFWEDFTARVNEAIATEFFAEVTVRVKVKRPLVHKFNPIVKLVEWAAAHLEGTGELPRFTLSGLAPSATSQPGDTFRREGEYWRIVFHGREFLLRDRKGLDYIAYLLGRPGQELHVLELVRVVDKEPASVSCELYSKLSRERLNEIGLSESGLGDAEPILDRKAMEDFRRKRKELQEEVEDAEAGHDLGRAERARAALESFDEHLKRVIGRGGRPRQTRSARERARVNVKKLISAAIDAIETQDAHLGHHLRAHINTGTSCVYAPDTPPDWLL